MGFHDDLFHGGIEKKKLSRSQNRANRRVYTNTQNLHPLDLTTQELQQLQEEDETLATVRKAAEGEISSAGIGFHKKDGLIYRRWAPPGRMLT